MTEQQILDNLKEQEILKNLEEHFLEFIAENPQIKLSVMSNETGQNKDALRHFKIGRTQKLNRFAKPAILEVMRRYGFNQ
jgi:hypothetical protein